MKMKTRMKLKISMGPAEISSLRDFLTVLTDVEREREREPASKWVSRGV